MTSQKPASLDSRDLEADGDAPDGDETTLNERMMRLKEFPEIRMRTHDVVVGTADGLGVAASRAKANDANGAAVEADESIDRPENNTEQPKECGKKGVVVGLYRYGQSLRVNG